MSSKFPPPPPHHYHRHHYESIQICCDKKKTLYLQSILNQLVSHCNFVPHGSERLC